MNARPFSAVDRAWLTKQALGLLVVAVTLLMVFENTSLDLQIAQRFYDAASDSFPMQKNWFFSNFMHHGLKTASYIFGLGAIGLCILAWRGKVSWLTKPQALLAGLGMLLIPLCTTGLKQLTNRHCPWDVIDFGGYAPYVSLFASTPADLTRGVCFPAGHASAGFVWLIWAVALRFTRPVAARYWLIGGALAGLLMGAGRMLQGAHFLSHVLWSGWFAWALSLTLAALLRVPVAVDAVLAPENANPDEGSAEQAQ